jgi:hypothetical protein
MKTTQTNTPIALCAFLDALIKLKKRNKKTLQYDIIKEYLELNLKMILVRTRTDVDIGICIWDENIKKIKGPYLLPDRESPHGYKRLRTSLVEVVNITNKEGDHRLCLYFEDDELSSLDYVVRLNKNTSRMRKVA